jgi:hypothetical protein
MACVTLPVQAQTADPWAGVTLQPLGWLTTGKSPDMAFYYRLPVLRGAGVPPRIWLRFEYPTAKIFHLNGYGAYKSYVELDEVDCALGRTRAIQTQTFAENNLSGSQYSIDTPKAWEYPIPGTVADFIVSTVVCKK